MIYLSNIIQEWINNHVDFKNHIRLILRYTLNGYDQSAADIHSYAQLERGYPLWIASILEDKILYFKKRVSYTINASDADFFTKLEKLIKERHYERR